MTHREVDYVVHNIYIKYTIFLQFSIQDADLQYYNVKLRDISKKYLLQAKRKTCALKLNVQNISQITAEKNDLKLEPTA